MLGFMALRVRRNSMAHVLAEKWESWWFPGFYELFNMLAFAFWWELAFVVAAIPLLIIVALFSAFR